MNSTSFLKETFQKCQEPGEWILRSFILKKAAENGNDKFVQEVIQEIKEWMDLGVLNTTDEDQERLTLTAKGFKEFIT